MNHSRPTTIFLVTFAGYEIRLEMPGWVEDFFVHRRNTASRSRLIQSFHEPVALADCKNLTQSNFFAPVWEGLETVILKPTAEESPWGSFACAQDDKKGDGANLSRYHHENVAGVGVVALPSLPLQIRPSRRLEAQISMALGMVLVGGALALFIGLFGPVVTVEVRGVIDQWKGQQLPIREQQAAQVKNQVSFADYVAADKVLSSVVPESREFGLIIPKIGVNSRVTEAVDAADGKAYMEVLKQGLAHAAGSRVPGQVGDIFIFGHSTDYAWNVADWNALFYNLKDLEKGDKVYVYYQGKPRIYQVSEKNVYEPKDVSWLHIEGSGERLVLQTCWPPGTTLKRLVVFAEPLPEFTQLK